MRHFLEAVLRGTVHYASEKISACCLVLKLTVERFLTTVKLHLMA